jgi:pilus assembly protein CpaF
MRPDRIIVGEVRGGEALDMLQAMNTGHDGSLSTIHANSPRDALARVETMVLMAGLEFPVRAVRQQVSSALDLVVHVERFGDGARRVTSITEVQRMESDMITLQELFDYRIDAERGESAGALQPTGLRPITPKFDRKAVKLPHWMTVAELPGTPAAASRPAEPWRRASL